MDGFLVIGYSGNNVISHFSYREASTTKPLLPFFQDRALRKCPVDIFSEGARWREGINI